MPAPAAISLMDTTPPSRASSRQADGCYPTQEQAPPPFEVRGFAMRYHQDTANTTNRRAVRGPRRYLHQDQTGGEERFGTVRPIPDHD